MERSKEKPLQVGISYTAAGTIRTAANKKERKNRIIIHFVYHLALTTSAPPL
jgi:hypothetical protein